MKDDPRKAENVVFSEQMAKLTLNVWTNVNIAHPRTHFHDLFTENKGKHVIVVIYSYIFQVLTSLFGK